MLTSSSGLPSLPLYFLSSQLRTVAPWLLKATRNRSVSTIRRPAAAVAECDGTGGRGGLAGRAPRSWPARLRRCRGTARPAALARALAWPARSSWRAAAGCGLEEIGREEHHRAHQEEGEQQPHLHRHFFGRLCQGLLPPFTDSAILNRFRSENCASPDGIEAAGMKRMASRQAAQPHPHSPCRAISLDGFAHVIRTGRIEAARRGQQGETQNLYTRKRPALRSIAAEKEPFHFPLQLRQGSIERLAPRIDDDGPLRVQPVQVQADGLADAPLDAVAHHGIAERAGRSEADSRPIGLRLADAKGREQRAGVTGSLVIDSSEIFRSQQTDTFRKTSDGALPLGTDSEFLAASRAAARQHRAAVLGLHAGAESMSLRTVTIIRLKGAFRHC